MIRNIVFDIDGAITVSSSYDKEQVEKEVKKNMGEEFFEKYCITAYNYPHYIFPGYYALFQWLHSVGAKIFFFSSGIEERNIDFAQKVTKRAFGDMEIGIESRVFSRQHCIDTHSLPDEDKEKYQSIFYGQRKKKLSGIVVPAEEVPYTLLLDDDCTYMVKGEECNFIGLTYTYQYLRSSSDFSTMEEYSIFYKAYYVAGFLSAAFEMSEQKNMTLCEAAKYLQTEAEGKEFNKHFSFPSIQRKEYYIKGLEILRKFDDTLNFSKPIEDAN